MIKNCKPYGIYIPRYHKQSRFYRIFRDNFESFLSNYYTSDYLCNKYGDINQYQIDTVKKFLKCQDLSQGFGVAKCPECGLAYIVPFSCKRNNICPSCRMKKLLEYSEWLSQEVLLDMTHRHWVFTVPKALRCYFFSNRWLLNRFIESACKYLVFLYRKFGCVSDNDKSHAYPGIIGILQTAGSDLKFNPHCHIISTDGMLLEDGDDDIYIPVEYMPYDYIRMGWRNRVLNMLYNFKQISSEERDYYKQLYSHGFNVHGEIKDTVNDREVKIRLCQYMMRGLISEKNIVCYNRETDTVVMKYKYYGHFTTCRMSVYEFMARVMQHINGQTRYTRYYGLYSNRIRHRWSESGKQANIRSQGILRKDFRISWRKLIWKIWEIDPLICINCGTEMKLRFIVDPVSAKFELRRLRKMQYYYNGRWSNHSPPEIMSGAA